MSSDLSQLRFHESPVIRETPSKLAAEEHLPAKSIGSHESEFNEIDRHALIAIIIRSREFDCLGQSPANLRQRFF
jgi:hypothetical protein